MTIGEVASRSGLNASAIRFYEKQGLLPKPGRSGGRRQYDASILERLAVLQRARDCGFTLPEIRHLFTGFREGTPPSQRWQTLARRKLVELDELTRKIEVMKKYLAKSCECRDLQECGRRILGARSERS
ncbi:MAG TPA: MerR family transcriptional regulator [Candidatus Solibacter sp.]|jgi:MerR family redox-sensitive transcriptional activator SoxR